MKVERIVIQACQACSTPAMVFKTNSPITLFLLRFLTSNGYKEGKHFTKIGMLYVDNQDLTVSGPIGSDKLNVKCKKKPHCDQVFNDFEALLVKMG